MRCDEITARYVGHHSLFGEVGVRYDSVLIIPRESPSFVNDVNTNVTDPLWTPRCPNRTAMSAEPPPPAVNRGLIAPGR